MSAEEAQEVQEQTAAPVVEAPEEVAEESRDSVVSGEVEDKSVSGSEDKGGESEGVDDEEAGDEEEEENAENGENVENEEENGNDVKDTNGNDRKRVSEAHEAAEGDDETPVCKKKKTDDDEVETVDQAEAVIAAE